MIENILELAKLSPAVLYLGGLVYLYSELKKTQAKIEALLERYHTTLLEGITVLREVQKNTED